MDSSIGDALVVMAQDWKKGAVMIDGHGNFGSIEGDGAAAARYIECRLAKYSEDALLSDIKENTVDFVPNYDEQEKEPVVLPAKLPNLLINGSEGIAVGMATNIPPHNIGETVDAAVYYLDNPSATTEDLMNYVKGPDFPTGGIIANGSELKEIYETGMGKIKVRGKVQVEKEKGKERIVVTEIPFTMIGDGINKFLQQVAALVEDKTIPEIVDISNQSNKEGIRIIFDLKKGADTNNIINILYKKTKLEDTFGYNLLAISGGRPETMSLADVYRDFTAFQYEIYERKYRSLLAKTKIKQEIDEGLIAAVDAIDAVVETIRGSKSVKDAKTCLMTGDVKKIAFKTEESRQIASTFKFTDRQAEAILQLRLQRLVGLEMDTLKDDLKKTLKLVAKYEKLLSKKAAMKEEIKGELLRLKELYSTNRKTEIIDAEEIVLAKKVEKAIPVVVLMDRFHYIRCIDSSVYEKNGEGLGEDDKRVVLNTDTASKIIVFTDIGKAHTVKVKDIPLTKLRDKGVPIDNLSGYDSRSENLVAIMNCTDDERWIFASSDGLMKQVESKNFDVTRKTVQGTKLSQDAALVSVFKAADNMVTVETDKGYALSFAEKEIPVQGITARGVIGIKLTSGDVLKKAYASSVEKPAKRGGRGKK